MDQYYRSIISGQRAGVIPAVLRFVFEIASWFYTVIVVGRNWLYDLRVLRTHRLPVPVVSVGNITTGGTGKTPTVILVVKELLALGHKPAVLTRGYGAAKGQTADEVLVLRRECPGVPVVVNPNRVAGGREAIGTHGADVLVLDDGFQHRRLHRDLNIVLVDATEPVGIPGVLPRGSWREPPGGMARADVIMLTRCEQVAPELAELAGGLLSQWVSPRDIYQQQTRVMGVFDLGGREVPLGTLAGGKVLAFAGIANPESFLKTVGSLGLTVSAACWFDDHHNYRPADLAPLARLTQENGGTRDVRAWVTTLKDVVKLQDVPSPVPIWYVGIESRLDARGTERLRERLAGLFRRV